MLKQIIFTLLSAFVLSVTSQAAVFHWDCTKSPEACQNYCFAAFCRNKGGPYTYSRAGNADRRRESGVAGASPCSQARRGGALRWGGDAGNRWPNALIECDEWPPASTTQGGAGSMLRCIPKSDNGSAYRFVFPSTLFIFSLFFLLPPERLAISTKGSWLTSVWFLPRWWWFAWCLYTQNLPGRRRRF